MSAQAVQGLWLISISTLANSRSRMNSKNCASAWLRLPYLRRSDASPVFHVTISSAPDPLIQVGSTRPPGILAPRSRAGRSRIPTPKAGVTRATMVTIRLDGRDEHRPKASCSLSRRRSTAIPKVSLRTVHFTCGLTHHTDTKATSRGGQENALPALPPARRTQESRKEGG